MNYQNQATYVLGYAGVGQAPEASGVYTIFSSRREIYVGVSDDIRQSLFRHLNESTPCMNGFGPLSFSFELAAGDRRTALRQSLVTRLMPTCNRGPSVQPAHADGRRRSWLGRVWSAISGGLRNPGPRPFDVGVSPEPDVRPEFGVTRSTVVERPKTSRDEPS